MEGWTSSTILMDYAEDCLLLCFCWGGWSPVLARLTSWLSITNFSIAILTVAYCYGVTFQGPQQILGSKKLHYELLFQVLLWSIVNVFSGALGYWLYGQYILSFLVHIKRNFNELKTRDEVHQHNSHSRSSIDIPRFHLIGTQWRFPALAWIFCNKLCVSMKCLRSQEFVRSMNEFLL